MLITLNGRPSKRRFRRRPLFGPIPVIAGLWAAGALLSLCCGQSAFARSGKATPKTSPKNTKTPDLAKSPSPPQSALSSHSDFPSRPECLHPSQSPLGLKTESQINALNQCLDHTDVLNSPAQSKGATFSLLSLVNLSKNFNPKTGPQLSKIEDLEALLRTTPIHPLMNKRSQHELQVLSDYQVGEYMAVRELVANAIDAHFHADRANHDNATSQTDHVSVQIPKDDTLVIQDFGTGMNLHEVFYFLLSPNRSKNRLLVNASQATDSVAGRFGQGFFSVFSLIKSPRDRVTLITRKAGMDSCLKVELFLNPASEIQTKLSPLDVSHCPKLGTSVEVQSGLLQAAPGIPQKIVEDRFRFNRKLPITVNGRHVNPTTPPEGLTQDFQVLGQGIRAIGKPIPEGIGSCAVTVNGIVISDWNYKGMNIYPKIVLELPPAVGLTSDRSTLDFEDPLAKQHLREVLASVDRLDDLALLNSLDPVVNRYGLRNERMNKKVKHCLTAVPELLDLESLKTKDGRLIPFDFKRLIAPYMGLPENPPAWYQSQRGSTHILSGKVTHPEKGLLRTWEDPRSKVKSLFVNESISISSPLFADGTRQFWNGLSQFQSTLGSSANLILRKEDEHCLPTPLTQSLLESPNPITLVWGACLRKAERLISVEYNRVNEIKDPSTSQEELKKLEIFEQERWKAWNAVEERMQKISTFLNQLSPPPTDRKEYLKELDQFFRFIVNIRKDSSKVDVGSDSEPAWIDPLLRFAQVFRERRGHPFSLAHFNQAVEHFYHQGSENFKPDVFYKACNHLLLSDPQDPDQASHDQFAPFLAAGGNGDRAFKKLWHDPDWSAFLTSTLSQLGKEELTREKKNRLEYGQNFYYAFCKHEFLDPSEAKVYFDRCFGFAKQLATEEGKDYPPHEIAFLQGFQRRSAKSPPLKPFQSIAALGQWLKEKSQKEQIGVTLLSQIHALFSLQEQKQVRGDPHLDAHFESVTTPIHQHRWVQDMMGRDSELVNKEYTLAMKQNPNPLAWIKELSKNSIEAEANHIEVSTHEDPQHRLVFEMRDNGTGVNPDELMAFYIPKFSTKPKTKNDINFGWGFYSLFKTFEEVLVETSTDGHHKGILVLKKDRDGHLLMHTEVQADPSFAKGTKISARKKGVRPYEEMDIRALFYQVGAGYAGRLDFDGEHVNADGLFSKTPEVQAEFRLPHSATPVHLAAYSKASRAAQIYRDGIATEIQLESFLDHPKAPIPEFLKHELSMHTWGMSFNLRGLDLKQTQGRTGDVGDVKDALAPAIRDALFEMAAPVLASLSLYGRSKWLNYDSYYEFRDLPFWAPTTGSHWKELNQIKTESEFARWLQKEPFIKGGPSALDVRKWVAQDLVKEGILRPDFSYVTPDESAESTANDPQRPHGPRHHLLAAFDRDLSQTDSARWLKGLQGAYPEIPLDQSNILKEKLNRYIEGINIQRSILREYRRQHHATHRGDDHAHDTQFSEEDLSFHQLERHLSDQKDPHREETLDTARKLKSFVEAVSEKYLGLKGVELQFYLGEPGGSVAHAHQGQRSERPLKIAFNVQGAKFKAFQTMLGSGNLEHGTLLSILNSVAHEIVHTQEHWLEDSHNEAFEKKRGLYLAQFLRMGEEDLKAIAHSIGLEYSTSGVNTYRSTALPYFRPQW